MDWSKVQAPVFAMLLSDGRWYEVDYSTVSWETDDGYVEFESDGDVYVVGVEHVHGVRTGKPAAPGLH